METGKPEDALEFLDTARDVAKAIFGAALAVLLVWGATACVLSLEVAP